MSDFVIDLNNTGIWDVLEKRWNFCVGSCHAATALRGEWQEQMKKCHDELGVKRVRFHGLFNDDMSVVLKPMFSSQLKLSFANIDKIFDFLVSIGMQPFVELGFMPEAMASGKSTVFHYKGNTTLPADFKKWNWLVEEFLKHIIKRYGRGEVRQWFFEVWNEPNLGGPGSPYGFFAGSKEDYFELYKNTAMTVKKVDPWLKTGGPATSNNAWIPEFIQYCCDNHVPLDFISTHQYPTDVIVGYGVEDSANFKNPLDLNDTEKIKLLMTDEKAREQFLEEYGVFQKHLWEHVDRGIWTETAKRAVCEAGELPLYYTEWGSLAGIESDGPFGASFIAKTMLDGRQLAQGYSFWCFSDIFEESGQEAPVFHGGFGLLTQQGIPKAPYRAFELMNSLGNQVFKEVFREGTVDGYVFRREDCGAVQILLVNHHSLLHPIEDEQVHVTVKGTSKCRAAQIERIDQEHANALGAWKEMGSPVYINKHQYYSLMAASCIERNDLDFTEDHGNVTLDILVPSMGIALVTLFYEP